MPRIDPLQLLKCLSVLLSPEGGILTRDEVPRLVNLMTKFSKKLVSKCVYVLILKNTETSLVDMFMAEGGWALIQTWLQDGIQTGNWDLVKEILGLLLVTPVDVERLKLNSLPKLIKSLSRREDLGEVAQISNEIVQNWLTIVKGAHLIPIPQSVQNEAPQEEIDQMDTSRPDKIHETDQNSDDNHRSIRKTTFYKVAVKDGKQIIRKLSAEPDLLDENSLSKSSDEKKNSDDDRSNEKSSKSSNSSSKSKSSSRDKDRKSSHSSSSSRSRSSSSNNSSKDKDRRDRDKDKKDHDRSKHSSSKSSSRSSSSSSNKDKKDSKSRSNDSKEKQSEKDKDTLEKLKPQTLDKLGRIPKKSGSSEDKQKENKPKENTEQKKPSFSILNRKGTGEERTKTVKVYNSKMRSTGLEEEVKPPPPRSAKKPNPTVTLPTIPSKRPSPPRESNSYVPSEKKLKLERLDNIPERPGAIKLIPPKPKPAVLQESDMFMDALTASAPKKEAKRRKRRPSVTKESTNSTAPSPTASPSTGGDSQTPTSPTTTANTSFGFYQDTLHQMEKEDGDKEEDTGENNDTPASPTTPTDQEIPLDEDDLPLVPRKTEGGLKGVLLYAKKKGPKKSIKWKAEEDLVEVKYFELDETERVNVTKTFNDMAKMELSSEREALILSRKLQNEDNMEPQTIWRLPLILVDQPELPVVFGCKSLEKDIQFAREKASLPALYFDKRRIPDSPEEPIPENHQKGDPVIIPLDDPESQEIDLRNTPWPEPKGAGLPIEPQTMPPIFPTIPFNPNFNNMPPGAAPFPGIPPRFQGPPGPLNPMVPVPGGPNFGGPNILHNNMMGGPPMNPDMLNPGMFNPEGFMGPGNDPNFPMPQQFNGPQGPMFGPNNFRGRGGFRRGGPNNGGWVPMNGSRNNWKRGGGGPHRGGGRMCKNIQNHGYCRNGDNCPFVH